jgi:hypothetical protein
VQIFSGPTQLSCRLGFVTRQSKTPFLQADLLRL